MKHLPTNVWLLSIAYALIATLGATVVFIGGLIGVELAPVENLAGLFCAGLLVLLFFKNLMAAAEHRQGEVRPLAQILKQPVFWTAISCATVGYTVMSLL